MPTILPQRIQLAWPQSVIAVGVLVTIGCTIGALILAQSWFLPERPTIAAYKRRVMERHLDAETLILGASHSLQGIMPRLLSGRAVNLAGGAQDLYYCCALARRYVPEMPNLKRIVLEVEVWGWTGSLHRSSESWRLPVYYFGFGIPPQYWSSGSVRALAAFAARNPMYGQLHDPFDEDGFYASYGELDRKKGKEFAELHSRQSREADSQMHLADVIKMIRECKERGIDVVLVRLPAHHCYRDELDKACLKRLGEMVEQLRKTTPVRYLDYFWDERFTDEHFLDGQHLNVQGATVFSRILAQDLVVGE